VLDPPTPGGNAEFFARMQRAGLDFEVVRTDAFRDAGDHAPILAEFEMPTVSAAPRASL